MPYRSLIHFCNTSRAIVQSATITSPSHIRHQPFTSSARIAMIFNGGCYCGNVRYQLNLDSPDDARMSICHCRNCKKFTGSEFGITAKIPKKAFRITQGQTKQHVSNNGSSTLTREFCDSCGSGILEYGGNAGENTYVFYGSLDEPDKLPPKGEFFCKNRAEWMPEIPGMFRGRE